MAEITWSSGGRSCQGYLADGSGGKTAPGILVLHEGNGLSANTRSKCDSLAEIGFVAFAVDMFAGSEGEPMAILGALVQDNAEWRARLNCGLDALAAQPHVDKTRLAAIGFCFGGSSAIELARSGADLKAVVGFHSGLGSGVAADSKNIKASVLVCIGDADPLIPKDQRDAFLANMAEHNVDCQMLLLTGVEHSFTNKDAASIGMAGLKYDARAERRSWVAMKDLFDETFGT
ncbi:MAG: dienelactone hydrolase family protein [Novosphingobium sp.]